MAVQESFLSKVSDAVSSGTVEKEVKRSAVWFKEKIKGLKGELRNRFSKTNARTFYREAPDKFVPDRLGRRMYLGDMFCYWYNPKHRMSLPYYDMFPLVVIAEPLPTGFSGINLHYIPPLVRARLLGKLMDSSDIDIDIKSKLRSQWSFIRNFSRFPEVRGAVKKYLTRQVTSRMYKVNPVHWKSAIFLDTQQFVGAREGEIYRQSAKRPERKRAQV